MLRPPTDVLHCQEGERNFKVRSVGGYRLG
jgi:hypothetical protein